MTAIVGLQTKYAIYLASDSLLIQNGSIKEFVPTKIFRKGSFLIGIAGDWRCANIIEHVFKVPKRVAKRPFMHYLYNRFLPALRGLISENAGEDNEYIVAVKNGHKRYLLVLDDGFNFHLVHDPFVCAGSAEELCYGALAAQRRLYMDEEIKDRAALDVIARCVLQTTIECAIDYIPSCGGTVQIEKL